MADMRFFKPDHHRAELRQAEPLRHLATQYPTFGFGSDRATFAGDHQHKSQALAVGALQKSEQRLVGSGLRHAMQIKPGVDLLASPRKP